MACLRIGEDGDYDVFIGMYSLERIWIERWLWARVGAEAAAFAVLRHGEDEGQPSAT